MARPAADPRRTPRLGLAINAVGAALVFRRGGEDLNLRASFLHLAGDALGSLGVIAAGLIIITTGWEYADPLFSVRIGVLVLASAWTVLRDSSPCEWEPLSWVWSCAASIELQSQRLNVR